MDEKERIHSFCAFLRAGLWEQECRISSYHHIDYKEIYRLAQEQLVVGLIAAGLEHVIDELPPKEVVLAFVGESLLIEQRNSDMNAFIEDIVGKMYDAGIRPILVKGQGVAQCYENPLWRFAGDVDLLLSEDDYQKAATFLKQLATSEDEEKKYTRHIALSIENWEVELHGTMRTGLWKRFDKVLDDVQNDLFYCGNVRSWMDGNTQISLPRADEDVVYVFAHILQHFYKEGVGLRQICDWCRLIWTHGTSIDKELLQHRLYSMGVMSEWKAFASLAVNYLGMQEDAIPFYSPAVKWIRKAERILTFIFETGSFGHKRDYSFYKKSYLMSKTISFWRQTCDAARYFPIFPLDTMTLWFQRLTKGIGYVAKGQ